MDSSGKVSQTDAVKVDLKPDQDSAQGWGSCLKRVWGMIPQDYRNELAQLFKLAGPVVSLDPDQNNSGFIVRAVGGDLCQSWNQTLSQFPSLYFIIKPDFMSYLWV